MYLHRQCHALTRRPSGPAMILACEGFTWISQPTPCKSEEQTCIIVIRPRWFSSISLSTAGSSPILSASSEGYRHRSVSPSSQAAFLPVIPSGIPPRHLEHHSPHVTPTESTSPCHLERAQRVERSHPYEHQQPRSLDSLRSLGMTMVLSFMPPTRSARSG